MKLVDRRGVIGLGFVLVCAGFGPAGSCAKACGKAGSSGDDLARGVGNAGDDLARYRPPPGGYTPRRGGMPVVIPGGAGAIDNLGGDLAHLSGSSLDNAVAALPEVQGSAAALARQPSASGLRLTGIDAAKRTFGRDYARTLDDLDLTAGQHDAVLEVLDVAQEIAFQAVDLLGEDEADDPSGTPTVDQEALGARARLADAAVALDTELASRLRPDQLQLLYATLGTAQVIVYRLGRDRPIQRPAATP
jgi:hypothetical protein